MEKKFNPNDLSQPNGNYFALPYEIEDSQLVIMSAPYDVTTSYKCGSSRAPDAIIDASTQIDLYDLDYKNIYEKGISTLPLNDDILSDSIDMRKIAEKIIEHQELGGSISNQLLSKSLLKVNNSSVRLNDYVYESALEQLDNGRKVALVGGDHSTPLGLIKALASKNESFGILHIDAHADLREAFEGFKYSHASIMYNVLNEVEQVSAIVQVGVRDFCQDEYDIITENEKITTFFDINLAERKFEGEKWGTICDEIVEALPDKVYISFDIDGLHAAFCPGTGTPVPGGLEYNEAIYLINKLATSGKEIIGFDLNEVSPSKDSDWDANVGARILYKMSLALLFSNNNNVK